MNKALLRFIYPARAYDITAAKRSEEEHRKAVDGRVNGIPVIFWPRLKKIYCLHVCDGKVSQATGMCCIGDDEMACDKGMPVCTASGKLAWWLSDDG